MTLSRWRRVATGVAAGVIVLCAALLGGSFRGDGSDVSVASDLRADDAADTVPDNVIEIPEDTADDGDSDSTTSDSDSDSTTSESATSDSTASDSTTDPVTVIEPDDLPDPAEDADGADEAEEPTGDTDSGDTDSGDTDSGDTDSGDTDSGDTDSGDTGDTDSGDTAAPVEPTAAPVEPTAAPTAVVEQPLTAGDDALGTGGGVDDAECALDRLVIYAGARRGGVAGSIRNALARAGFGAGCPAPVTVLASNCPLQFAGVLGTGSGYDPMQSFVASSSSVDRETMTAVLGAVGYTGAEINILDFGFVNPDRPGEQWMAIFIPPSFTGWEQLADRAGLGPTTSSLCSASGELVG